jgi:HEPN domain-containing protein
MSVQRYEHADPREWLNRARSNLQLARMTHSDVYLEELCFETQQAAEKAIKAVLLHKGVRFPYVHDLDNLLQLLISLGHDIPDRVRQAGDLTRYAVGTRYPGALREASGAEYQEALSLAEAVVRWAEAIILGEASPRA